MIKGLSLFLIFFVIFGCKNDIRIERIIFHSSFCFGTCPTYHLELDNKKSFKLFAEKVYTDKVSLNYTEDTAKMGYFTGAVNDSTFVKLTNAIKTVGIDTLSFNNETCCDGSLITIIIYYNGKRKYLKSMFPPAKAELMINVLFEICSTSKLVRTHDKFVIEE
jgi:hypothetical protein